MDMVVATRNAGKMRDLRELLSGLPIRLLSVDEAGLDEVEETGDTYVANARLKARAALAQTGKPSLGEDSGIEIDALGGEPGLHSARFAGPDASDDDRNDLVRERLADVPPEGRTCRYRCAVVVALPDGEIVSEGVCEGRISTDPRGANGFGYDPIVLLPDRDLTMAELTHEEKNALSHRGKALAVLRSRLETHLGRKYPGSEI